MAVTLSADEIDLVDKLHLTGLSRPAAVLAVVLATRDHARPEDEIVEIVRQYPSLEDSGIARQAVRDLRTKGWLVESTSYGRSLTHQSPSLRQQIADAIGDACIKERLQHMRASLEPYVQSLGAMADGEVYASFLRRLEAAQFNIFLPMLATSPYAGVVQVLQSRAAAGVKVQILLGKPSLVAEWRGEAMGLVARDRESQWRQLFKNYPTVEIRTSSNPEDMALATCLGIDGKLIRIDIYDPLTQRSLEGVMVEIRSPHRLELNLITVFNRLFQTAWDRAGRSGFRGWLERTVKSSWTFLVAVPFMVFALIPTETDFWPGLSIGIAGGILAIFVLESAPSLFSKMWRFIVHRYT
jgi:predicted transcriptional regulator